MEEKYKVGYYDEKGRRHYKIVDTKKEALELVSEMIDISSHISIKRENVFILEDE